MKNFEKIKQYIKNNPDVDFNKYLAKELQNKKFSKFYFEEKIKLEIAMEIYRLRKKKRITQEQLAESIKMPQSNIARIEQGKYMPNISTLAKIFNALGQISYIKIGQQNICLNSN